MDTKKYNNILACRRYYERNRHNPEFQTTEGDTNKGNTLVKNENRSSGRYFKDGNTASVKIQPVAKIKQIKTTINSQLKCFILKRKRLLLKAMMQSWKDYERTPKPTHNPNYASLLCAPSSSNSSNTYVSSFLHTH
jgi:hypothetical protein